MRKVKISIVPKKKVGSESRQSIVFGIVDKNYWEKAFLNRETPVFVSPGLETPRFVPVYPRSCDKQYFGEIRNQLFFPERRLLSYLSQGVGRVAKRNMSHSKALCQTNTTISSDVVLEGILAVYDEFSDFSSKLTAPQCRIDCRHRFHHNKLRTCSFSNLKVSGCSSGLGLLNKL